VKSAILFRTKNLTRFPEIPQEQTPHVIILPPIYSAAENSGNISKRQNFPKKQKNSEIQDGNLSREGNLEIFSAAIKKYRRSTITGGKLIENELKFQEKIADKNEKLPEKFGKNVREKISDKNLVKSSRGKTPHTAGKLGSEFHDVGHQRSNIRSIYGLRRRWK